MTDYSQLEITPEQRAIVDDLARIIAETAGLSPAPMRGFFWRSLREWQKNNQLPTTAIRDMSPRRRIHAGQEIFKTFKEHVLGTLQTEQERQRFRLAYAEGFDAWVAKYSGVKDEPDD